MINTNHDQNQTTNNGPLQNAGGTGRHNHFKLYNMYEILSRNIETNWLIEDYIEKYTTGVLYGPSGSYKTFLALDWSLSIATGNRWHGHDVKSGLVVYVAGEGNHGLQKRIKAWLTSNRIEGDDIPFAASNKRVAILNPDELSVFRHQLEQYDQPINLIVIDTLRKCFGHGDENHSKDMGQFLDEVECIRQDFDTTCLIVHHTNKSKIIRGSNALESDVDFVYRLESGGKLSCSLHAEKLKDSDQPSPMQFDMINVQIGKQNEKPVSSLILKSTKYQPQSKTFKLKGNKGIVYDYIKKNYTKPVTWTKLIKDMIGDDSMTDHMLTKSNIRTALNGLKESNIKTLKFTKLKNQNAVIAV